MAGPLDALRLIAETNQKLHDARRRRDVFTLTVDALAGLYAHMCRTSSPDTRYELQPMIEARAALALVQTIKGEKP